MPRRIAWLSAALASIGLFVMTFDGGARAETSTQSAVGEQKGRDQVATCLQIEGALLQRTKDGHFKTVKTGDTIAPHTLLIGFPKADLVSSCGKVKIELLLYLGDKLPVTESAISLNDSPDLNADITIDRGVVGLKNLAPKGEAVVRVRAGDQVWTITLKEPDSAVVVARFGRHEPGIKLLKAGPKGQPLDAPLMHLGMLVLKGHVTVNTGKATYAMNAPPGPALITWDTGTGYEVRQMDQLPEEVVKFRATGEKVYQDIADSTAKIVAGDMGKNLDRLVDTDKSLDRRVAVASMGALDDLPRLVAALENTKHEDVREGAIVVLRNWIGREPGQLTKLYDFLTKDKKYQPKQARTILLLLKGFDDSDRKEPAIYQLLIEALEQAPLPIRELAHWHLERLVPAGQKIAYDAAADEATRSRAAKEWRALIPEGQLPPPPPKKDEIKKGA